MTKFVNIEIMFLASRRGVTEIKTDAMESQGRGCIDKNVAENTVARAANRTTLAVIRHPGFELA